MNFFRKGDKVIGKGVKGSIVFVKFGLMVVKNKSGKPAVVTVKGMRLQ